MKRKISKKLLAGIGALGLLLLLFTSCLKSEKSADTPPTALVSFVQASPDEPPLDLSFSTVVNSNALNYGDHLDYFSAFAGQRTVNIFQHGTFSSIVSTTETLMPNTAYSLFLANVATKPELFMLTDTLNKPASGFASVRLVNMSPDAPAVDLVVQGGSVVVANKWYKGYSSFVPMQGKSNFTFNVVKTGTNTVLATLPNVTLNNGFVYTIWFHGLVASTTSADNLAIGVITNAYFN